MKSSSLSAANKAPALFRWKSMGKAALAALLLAAAFPPVPLFPLIFIAFVPVLLIIEQKYVPESLLRLKETTKGGWRSYLGQFRHTYLIFLIWNLLCCYWLMITALSVPTIGEAIEASIAGLMASLANPVLMSLPLFAYRFVRRRLPRWAALVGFVLFWLTFEYLHFRWDLTWSWITLGHSATYFPFYIQYLEFTGVLGISLQILIVNALIFELICRWRERALATGKTQPFVAFLKDNANRRLTASLVGLLVLPVALNPLITFSGREAFRTTGTMNVRVVQPNIDPYMKFGDMSAEDQLKKFIRMAEESGCDTIDLVVLPETAIPYPVLEETVKENPFMNRLDSSAKRHNYSILTGLMPDYIYGENEKPSVSARYSRYDNVYYDRYNGAYIVGSPDNRFYHKGKLVPFTERTPFLAYLGDMDINLGGGVGGFGLPDSLNILRTGKGVGVLPVICYESQFGDYIREGTLKGARLCAIITNDGWFGRSSGYIQHAYFTVLRSIELRRDFARSANTGMSLFCDSKGRVSQPTGWWVDARIDQKLNLYDYKTFYAYYGDYLGVLAKWLSLALILGVIGLGFMKK